MSVASIYRKLISAGLTEEGACALMGNMQAESAMRSNNVQDGMGYPDDQYTADVDNGRISRESFATDSRGYGLCQWTYPTRKRALYDYAAQRGVSIGDEEMQVDFCIQEFPLEAPDTYKLLKTSNDIAKCAEWICRYYERPAVNNIAERTNYAKEFYNKRESYGSSEQQIQKPSADHVSIPADEYKRLTTAATIVDLMFNIKELMEDYSNADLT